jgi:hypothetical protein
MTPQPRISVLPYESSNRKIMAYALSEEYVAYPSFADAQVDENAVIILEAARGEQIYLTCNIRAVHCSEEILDRLLKDLDQVAWSGGDPDQARIFYERHRPGTVLAGGTGGGRVTSDLWIHQQFERFDLTKSIKAVIAGEERQL